MISGDPVAAIAELKEAPGKDIVQYGFGQLSPPCSSAGCWTSCGSGCTRCSSGSAEPGELLLRPMRSAHFDLVDTTTLQNGIVVLGYRYAPTS